MKRGLGKIAAINNWFEPSVDLWPNIYSRALLPHTHTHTRAPSRVHTHAHNTVILFSSLNFPFLIFLFVYTHCSILIKRKIPSNFLTRILVPSSVTSPPFNCYDALLSKYLKSMQWGTCWSFTSMFIWMKQIISFANEDVTFPTFLIQLAKPCLLGDRWLKVKGY